MSRDVLERLADKFTVGDGCWEWTGYRAWNGYGSFHLEGRPRAAHRVVYELMRGPVPADRDLDHLCRNRGCVNPGHLEPVTRGENIRRGLVPDVQRARHARQTHCKHGHLLAGENIRLVEQGSYTIRRCIVCVRERQRVYRQRKVSQP